MTKTLTYKCGWDYASEMANANDDAGPVGVNEMLGQTTSIPSEDYMRLKRRGVVNPSAREYWRGYNAFFKETQAPQSGGAK